MTLELAYRQCVECGASFTTSHDSGSRISWGYPYCADCILKPSLRRIIAGTAA